ncbi:MAG: hypothetical protein QHH02_05745, partial [Syntrophomonadaceae bacterium]|nr:hypothetical protein [Syntrophomonadaceae bacterium]
MRNPDGRRGPLHFGEQKHRDADRRGGGRGADGVKEGMELKAAGGRDGQAAKDRRLLMKQRAFLAAYAELGVAAAAAEAAMIGLADHQRW